MTRAALLRSGTLAAALAIGLMAARPAPALPPDAPLPGEMTFPDLEFTPPRPVRFELDNGLVVHFLEDQSLPLVEVTALIQGGAVHESATKTGLAGLTATVMRTGGTATRNPVELNVELEDMASFVEIGIGEEGANASAWSLARHFPQTAAILADVLRNPALAPEKLEIARARAIEGVRRQNDDPLGIADREITKLCYPEHPYGRFSTVASLEAITRDDLRAFHALLFHPDRTLLAVSGAITEAELRSILAGAFADWPRSSEVLPPTPAVTPPRAARVTFIPKDVNQSVIRMGHLGIDVNNPDRTAISVMNYILGRSGSTSRLAKKVRVEAGIAYSVGSTFTMPRSTGLFLADTETAPETTAQAIELMLAEIERMRADGITPVELEAARSAILNRDIFQYATAHRIAVRAAELEFDGFPPDQHERDWRTIAG